MEAEQAWAYFKLISFLFCSVNLLISIVKTITTPPGYIPEDTEWDMPSGSEERAGETVESVKSKQSGEDLPRDSGLTETMEKHNRSIEKSQRKAKMQE